MDMPMPVKHVFDDGFEEPYSDVAKNYNWTEEYLRRACPNSGFTPAARALFAGRTVMARWFFACGARPDRELGDDPFVIFPCSRRPPRALTIFNVAFYGANYCIMGVVAPWDVAASQLLWELVLHGVHVAPPSPIWAWSEGWTWAHAHESNYIGAAKTPLALFRDRIEHALQQRHIQEMPVVSGRLRRAKEALAADVGWKEHRE